MCNNGYESCQYLLVKIAYVIQDTPYYSVIETATSSPGDLQANTNLPASTLKLVSAKVHHSVDYATCCLLRPAHPTPSATPIIQRERLARQRQRRDILRGRARQE